MVRALQNDPIPQYDVPFICDSCRGAFGNNPQTGAFPWASVCEFKYANNRGPWRIFVCCADAAQVHRQSFGLVAEYFKTVWRRDGGVVKPGQVVGEQAENAQVDKS